MLRAVRRITAPLGLALVLALAFQGPALAATVNVSILDFAFSPASAIAKQGDMVLWTNNGNAPHTTTSDGCAGTATTGVGLWCSRVLNDNDTFPQVFSTAAKYPYFCDVHPAMQGTVQVNMKANPKSGGVGTTFTIIWAKGSIPTGFNADIQIKRPGSTQFVDWMVNKTGTMVSAQFQPDTGTGIYQFRSRLQKGTGGASDYSKVTKITVS
ncbi:MAG: hypothetical protein H0W27_07850 [Actinobacteria bacterium]|nr:hypothetical protein [Actinomycetota bacterium]